jgi:hypothetical protein
MKKPTFAVSLLTFVGQSSYHNEFESIARTLDPTMDHEQKDVW